MFFLKKKKNWNGRILKIFLKKNDFFFRNPNYSATNLEFVFRTKYTPKYLRLFTKMN